MKVPLSVKCTEFAGTVRFFLPLFTLNFFRESLKYHKWSWVLAKGDRERKFIPLIIAHFVGMKS